MKPLYLFEFCDQAWIPSGARECLFEAMDACNSGLRSFNAQVADVVLELAVRHDLDKIVELGAGRAPITSHLAKDERTCGMTLVPTDVAPNDDIFQRLGAEYGERVQPEFSPVDITQPHDVLESGVLVMAGMMHHVPFELRPAILKTLSNTRSVMALFEPLKRTPLSMLLASLAFWPALALPLTRFKNPGKWRRFLWCWFVPIVPWMFAWDGVTSCLRQWTAADWQAEFDRLEDIAGSVQIESGFNSLKIIWLGKGITQRFEPATCDGIR